MSNPSFVDVDRLSIDDRLRVLESRVIGGGSGSGGIVFPDFDALPDNSITLSTQGLCIKFSESNLGTTFNNPAFTNIGMKLCVFKPFYGGLLTDPYFVFYRTHYLSTIPIPSQGNVPGGKSIPFQVGSGVFDLFYGTNLNVFNLEFRLGGLSQGGIQIWNLNQRSISLSLIRGSTTQATVNLYSSMLSSSTGLRPMDVGYNFMAESVVGGDSGQVYTTSNRYAALNIGGSNNGSNLSVPDLSNLPQYIRNVFPASWTR